MLPPQPPRRYRFGVFEADPATGELRRKGMRIKLHSQPFQLLMLLLDRPGQMLTREEICRELWPEGTFVDYDQGLNSAVNRLREAIGDKAANPTFIETLARRGYRFLIPVEHISDTGNSELDPASASTPSTTTTTLDQTRPPTPKQRAAPAQTTRTNGLDKYLARAEDLPDTPRAVVRTLFLLLQMMYLGFYIGALSNLPEITEILAALPHPARVLDALIVIAALLIPVRTFMVCAVLFHAPRFRHQFLSFWPLLLLPDALWSVAPFLLLHHISYGLALACMTFLVYSPFAQRSLILMGAAGHGQAAATSPPIT